MHILHEGVDGEEEFGFGFPVKEIDAGARCLWFGAHYAIGRLGNWLRFFLGQGFMELEVSEHVVYFFDGFCVFSVILGG